MKPEFYWKGDLIIQEGDVGDWVFFMVSGEVDIVKGDKKVAKLSEPCAFGEKALESNVKRLASI